MVDVRYETAFRLYPYEKVAAQDRVQRHQVVIVGGGPIGMAMALDLGPYGIRVNALMPGSIDTSGLSLDERRRRGENVPLERIGEPYDMTGAAIFLASDDASYITGDVIKVDGGMLAQQRSATVDIMPPADFPKIENL